MNNNNNINNDSIVNPLQSRDSPLGGIVWNKTGYSVLF